MQTRRWINQSQPQTMVIAVFLLYFNAAILLFNMLSYRTLGALTLIVVAASVGAAWGIANEKKWGYYAGVAMAFLPFALRLYYGGGLIGPDFLNFLFEVALVALLLHPQSRDYERIWFK